MRSLPVFLGYCMMVAALSGCGPSTYPYRAVEGGERVELTDRDSGVRYIFRAEYQIDVTVRTIVCIDIMNSSDDTLDLSQAYVKVRSRNVLYQYNDRFLPILKNPIPPLSMETVILTGEGRVDHLSDPWYAIAGEELVLTLKGLRLGEKEIAEQVVRFIPHNPMLSLRREG